MTPAPTITERQLDHAATLPASNDLTSTPDSSVSRRRLPAQRSSRRVQSDEEEEEEEQENSDDQEESTGFKSHLRRRHHRLIPHPLARPIVVPTRLRVAGRVQELSEADLDFLDIAFELDLPCTWVQRNPKQKQSRSKNDSKSRLRCEKYKAAVTLRDAKRMGASFADLRWDFIHGFIDFGEARDPQVQEAAI